MGLFRLAVVIGVGVSLLPSDREKQEQLYQRAASAAAWTMTFCERNGETCRQASGLWSEFSKKAEFGAKLAMDAMKDGQPDRATSSPVKTAEPARALERPSHVFAVGTLTRDDLAPAWRGKTATKSAP